VKNIQKSILSLIGNTPILEIKTKKNITTYAKLEYFNPTGSIKDRTALYMIEKAEKEGLLKPGGTIIEASSGNQAISVSMIANAKGYNSIITFSDDVSLEKQKAIEAYGAKIVRCKCAPTFFHEDHYYATALRLSKEIPNSFLVNQYFNKNNAETHYMSTGPEIYNQLEGDINYLFAAVGSGGTINGVSKYLKEKNKNIKVIGVYAKGSRKGQNGEPIEYHIDGMGINYDTPFLDSNLIDELVCIDDNEAHEMARYLSKNKGLLFGPVGSAVLAAIEKYENLKESDKVAFIVTDSGRSYLSKKIYF